MAGSVQEIVNLALSIVGDTAFVNDLATEDTAQARAGRVLYPQARDGLLAEYDWPFARKRATLGLLDAVTRSGWGYVYALPADCLYAREVYSTRNPARRTPYRLEHHDGATVLLTDQETPELIYTGRLEEVTLYPAPFVDALAARLAIGLAMALAASQSIKEQARREYEVAPHRLGEVVVGGAASGVVHGGGARADALGT
jgi:hypothetical protein